MPRNFTITTPAETIRVSDSGRAEVVFTVTNVSGAPERALVRPVPLGNTRGEWLAVVGEREREFTTGATQQFTVTAVVPPATPGGRYGFRADAVSARRAGEEYDEGPVVWLDVAASEAPAKSRWWIWAAAAALVLVVVAIAFLVWRGSEPPVPAQPVVADAAPVEAPAEPEPEPEPEPPPDPKAAVPRSGLALWLTGDDAVNAAAGRLETWRSAELRAAHAIAVSADARPSVIPGLLNGRAVLRFDGQDDMLKANIDISPAAMPEATVFAVFSSATDRVSPLRKLYGNDDGHFDRAVGLDPRSPHNYGVFTGSGVAPYFVLPANEFQLTVDQYTPYRFNGWVNGRRVVSELPATWGPALPNLYIGGTGLVWREYWYGDLAEMIVYDRVLTAAERTAVEDYLAAKYALSITR